jgi:hypothetical protein
MNGWVSILFTVVGGIMLLMKNKTNENGGGGYTVVNDNNTAPSPSEEENIGEETNSETDVPIIDTKAVTIEDVMKDPSILDILKITDRDKYESLTRSIWNNESTLNNFTSTHGWKQFNSKENEVIRLLDEGFKAEYVGIKGDYWMEIFTKYEPNIGWNGDEKVGVTLYEVLANYPGREMVSKRNWELATAVNLEHPIWNENITLFERVIK